MAIAVRRTIACTVAASVLLAGCGLPDPTTDDATSDVPVIRYDEAQAEAAIAALEAGAPESLVMAASPTPVATSDSSDDPSDQPDDAVEVTLPPTGDPTPTPTPAATYAEVVEAPLGLNVRSGPSTADPVISQIETGSYVETTGTVGANGWIEVLVDGTTGWVAPGFLDASTGVVPTPTPLATPTPTAVPNREMTVVNVPVGLNLRGGPGTDHPVIAELVLGTVVVATGATETVDGDAWVEVRHDGRIGWMSAAFLGDAPLD